MTGARRAVYVGCAGDNAIVRYAFDADTGGLEALERTGVPGPREGVPQSLPLAVSPDGRRLYAALRTAPFPVLSFAIDRGSGALAAIGSATLPGSAAYIATDRTGRCLLCASYPASLVAALRIDARGCVTDDATQVVTDVPKAHSVLVDPSNRYALVASLGADRIFRYDLDAAAGRIAPAASVATRSGAGPRHLALHPTLARLYCINETDGTIDTYALARTPFALTLLQSVDMRPPFAAPIDNARAADIHVTPDGRFLYGTERVHSTLAAFVIDRDNGTLTRIASYPTQEGARAFRIDASGRWLIVAGQVSGRISVYAIDAERGTLREAGDAAAGPGATWVEIVALEGA